MTLSLVILEGADATGKSTYAEHLVKFGNSVLLHFGKPPADWRSEYYERIAQWPALHTILDRSFIGSRVWARMGFHPEPLNEKHWRSVSWAYARHSQHVEAMVILRDHREIREEILNRGETSRQSYEAQAGQTQFLNLLARNEVYYIPIAAHSSNRLQRLYNKKEQ